MDPRTAQTRLFSISREADGIVRVSPRNSDRIEVADAESALSAITEISEGKMAPMLIDLRQVGQLSREAQRVLGQPRSRNVGSMVAFVGRTALDRALGNIFLMLTASARGGIPAKIFGSEAEAMAWLRQPGAATRDTGARSTSPLT